MSGTDAGDVNGDGIDDFVINENATELYVVYGTAASQWPRR